MQNINIGTRGSELALWQANHVKSQLESLGYVVTIKILKTQGDNIQHLSFDKLEGKGFFTKEIEDALLNKTIDLAVHSHKDLPTNNPLGLIIAAVSERENPMDLMLIRKEKVDKTQLFSLQLNATVGTSSLRRKTQLQAFRSDANVIDLRGNVPTRINKLREGLYDAIVIACAGIERLKLDISDLHSFQIPAWQMVPAPAQGVLALQIREEDIELLNNISKLNDTYVAEKIKVERGVLNLFDGGCQLPLGVYCHEENGIFKTSVSKAKDSFTAPVRMYFESNDTLDLHKKIVRNFNKIVPKKIFISNDDHDFLFLKKSLNDNGFLIESKSFIKIHPIPFREFKKTDWIFFNSKNAAKYFLENKPKLEKTKLAAIGEASANLIRNFGYEVAFVGSEDSTNETAIAFAKLIENETVLFPQSKNSLQTIASYTKKENCFFIDIYETVELNSSHKVEADIYVFTSPSNSNSFFKQNKIVDKKIIAIGKATYDAIKQFGYSNVECSRKPSELCLLEKVYELSSQ
jgi:hydroxymethylbilane synthase